MSGSSGSDGEGAIEGVVSVIDTAGGERRALNNERRAIAAERRGMRREREAMQREREAMQREREAIVRERERFDLGWSMLDRSKAVVAQELRAAAEERQAWQRKRECLKRRKADMRASLDDLKRREADLNEREALTSAHHRPTSALPTVSSSGGDGQAKSESAQQYQQVVEVARLRVELEMQRERIESIRQAWEQSLAEAEKTRAEIEHRRDEWETERERQAQERRELEQERQQIASMVISWRPHGVLPHLRDLPGIGNSPVAAAAAATATDTKTPLSPIVALASVMGGPQGLHTTSRSVDSSAEPRHHIISDSPPRPLEPIFRHYAHQHQHWQPPRQYEAVNGALHSQNPSSVQHTQHTERVHSTAPDIEPQSEDCAGIAATETKGSSLSSSMKNGSVRSSPEWLSSSDEDEGGGEASSQPRKKRQRRDVPSSDLYGPSNIRTRKTWEERFEDLKRYKKQNGHLCIPYTEKGSLKQLYEWMCSQRKNHRNHALKKERFEKLDALGFPWMVKRDAAPRVQAETKQQLSSGFSVHKGPFQLPSLATALQEALDQCSPPSSGGDSYPNWTNE